MNVETTIKAWQDPEFRSSLGELGATHPAGALARELDASELALAMGGDCGCGWICTVTGECTCTNGFTVCSWSFCC